MKEKPNVVIIMADQLRADALGEHTPNINKIAEEGAAFNRAYCASPICVPARGAFFTGRYPNSNGSLINPWDENDAHHGNVRAGIKNLYKMLEEDWDSWHTGKQHLYTEEKMDKSPDSRTHWINTQEKYKSFLKSNGKRTPGGADYSGIVPEMAMGRVTRRKNYSIPTTGCYNEGFEYFFDGYFANGAIDAIQKRDKDRPLLLNAMFLAPHPPLEIPEPWYSKIKNIDLPENVGKWCPDQSPLQLYNLPGVLGARYTRKDWGKIWPVYMGLVSLLDYCVGMIINELKNQGIYEDTLIIFTSDHGEMLGSHCLWQKMCMYEESVRIPLYIKFPRKHVPAVKVSDEPVSSVDVLPTICEYLDVELPDNLSGISLMPILEGKKPDRRDIYIQFDGNGARGNFQRCVVRGEYKLIADIFKDESYLELYNVKTDSQEMYNLAFEKEHENMIKDMVKSLAEHMEKTNDLIKIPDEIYEEFIKSYSLFRQN